MKKPKKSRKKKRKHRYKGPPAAKGKKKKYVWLNVLPQDMWIKVKRGVSLWEALRDRDVGVEGDCGGLGKCGKCKIRVVTAVGPPSAEAEKLLSPDELKTGLRLACRAKVKKDLVVSTEVGDDEVKFFQILKHGQMPIIQLDPLLDKKLVSVPPPSQEDPSSDVERLRKALEPEHQDLNISYRCISTLFEDLRKTQFEGAAVFHNRDLLAWQPGKMAARRYGLVFDIGTSTLVASLVSLLDGRDVAVVSCLSSQRSIGANVISRIQHVKEHPQGLSEMRKYLIKDLNILVKRLFQAVHLAKEDILIAVVAGNTTMQHFLLGMNPCGIAEAPFAPVTTEAMIVRAQDVGLHLHPEALVHVMPSKSGYIGGDLLAFVLASGSADEKDRMVLGLDFGTNGEIFLGNSKRMLTCSAAAGPALEGAKIAHGMIAKTGAIEGFRFADHRLRYHVIGNIKPKGLCGSGLVDLVALLLHHNLIDQEGLMRPVGEAHNDDMASRLIRKEGSEVYDFLVASTEESFENRRIYLRQNDIRELQLAKGAIAAGVRILMDEIGVQAGDIDVVYLAGALGNYVNPYSAMRVGLIPRVDPEKIISLGNAASSGAKMVLLSKQYWNKSTEIAQLIEHVELSTHPNLFDYFVEEMSFPSENLW